MIRISSFGYELLHLIFIKNLLSCNKFWLYSFSPPLTLCRSSLFYCPPNFMFFLSQNHEDKTVVICLTHVLAMGQERRNKPESSAAKALLLTSSGARESKRENGKTPSLLRRIILRLGRITPWLAAAHRPSCHHGKGRTHGGKTAPARVQIMFTT